MLENNHFIGEIMTVKYPTAVSGTMCQHICFSCDSLLKGRALW